MGFGPRLSGGNHMRVAWSTSPRFITVLGAVGFALGCAFAAAIRVVGGNGVAVLTGDKLNGSQPLLGAVAWVWAKAWGCSVG